MLTSKSYLQQLASRSTSRPRWYFLLLVTSFYYVLLVFIRCYYVVSLVLAFTRIRKEGRRKGRRMKEEGEGEEKGEEERRRKGDKFKQ